VVPSWASGFAPARGAVRWSTVSSMIAAWAITLPHAAVVSAAARRVGMLMGGV
jgi:phosphate/sulfate permease